MRAHGAVVPNEATRTDGSELGAQLWLKTRESLQPVQLSLPVLDGMSACMARCTRRLASLCSLIIHYICPSCSNLGKWAAGSPNIFFVNSFFFTSPGAQIHSAVWEPRDIASVPRALIEWHVGSLREMESVWRVRVQQE